MIKKISTLTIFILAVGLFINFTFINKSNNDRNQLLPVVNITGDEVSTGTTGQIIHHFTPNLYNYSDTITTITDVATGTTTIYDLQGNGVPQHIWMDPSNPDNIHITLTWNMTPGFPGADRRSKYIASNDRGLTWAELGDVPTGVAGGFPCIDGLSDSRVIIANHNSQTGTGTGTRLQVYVELTPGAGTFTQFDPGDNPFSASQVIWPRMIATSSINNTTKILTIGSINVTGADTVAYMNRVTNLGTPTFSGYVPYPDINNAETHNFARSSSGKIGIAYVRNDFNNVNNLGDVRYMESTDDGVTWSAPQTIWESVDLGGGDYWGCLRGVSLTYIGQTPKVAFELLRMTETGYYPSGAASVAVWPGSGSAVIVADSTWKQNGNGGATDVYTSICRPSISKSGDENVLFMAFEVSRADTDNIGSHYYDVYFTWSTNGGTNWAYPPKQLTNRSGPLRDCRFVNIAPWNDFSGGLYYANMQYQSDSVPGSVTQTPPAAESPAQQRFLRVQLSDVIGINNLGSEIPQEFSLSQNYPNPFNPSTKIKFDLPMSEFVTLKLYDVTGKLVKTLINEKVSAGVKEYELNASDLPSGVYFYSLTAGTFSATKKMVLVK